MRWHGGVGNVYTNSAAPEVTLVAGGPLGQSVVVQTGSLAIN